MEIKITKVKNVDGISIWLLNRFSPFSFKSPLYIFRLFALKRAPQRQQSIFSGNVEKAL